MTDDDRRTGWRAELANGAALTTAQLDTLAVDPAVPPSLRELVVQAQAGHPAANWMLGKAIDAGALSLQSEIRQGAAPASTLHIPADRRAECVELLAAWDARDRYDLVAVRLLMARLFVLLTDLLSQVPQVANGDASATLLREALAASALAAPTHATNAPSPPHNDGPRRA